MDIDALSFCPLCKNIPVHEREKFLQELNYKTKHYNKGGYIAHQGEVVKSLYILLKGSVKAEMYSTSGVILNIETISAPNPLASAFLFAENNYFPVDVVALETSEVVVIPKDSVMRLLASNEAFLKEFMVFNSNRTHFLSERLKFLSTKTIKGKLAQYILAKANRADFTLDMSQTALAEYFGVTRPSLSRSLAEMISEDIISMDGKKGKIINLMRLRQLVLSG